MRNQIVYLASRPQRIITSRLQRQSQSPQIDRVVAAHVESHASRVALLLHDDPREVVPEVVLGLGQFLYFAV